MTKIFALAVRVSSSTLATVVWDDRELYVEFDGGRWYCYSEVEAFRVDALFEADSKGQHFNQNFRQDTSRTCVKLTEEIQIGRYVDWSPGLTHAVFRARPVVADPQLAHAGWF